MVKKGKKKNVNVKPITNHDVIQIDVKASLETDKKINPKDIFEGINNKKKGKKKTTKTKTKPKY